MKRILVVDDEPTIRELVAEALREAGYRVDIAANGVVGLQVMRRRVPDAVVLDLMMPSLDGSGFVELMRLNPRLASVPILLATAADGAAEAAERIGARACLTKPFELEELLRAVAGLVGEPLPRALAGSAVLEPAVVESAAIESAAVESVAIESVATESVALESAATESVALESAATESVALESAATESVALDPP